MESQPSPNEQAARVLEDVRKTLDDHDRSMIRMARRTMLASLVGAVVVVVEWWCETGDPLAFAAARFDTPFLVGLGVILSVEVTLMIAFARMPRRQVRWAEKEMLEPTNPRSFMELDEELEAMLDEARFVPDKAVQAMTCFKVAYQFTAIYRMLLGMGALGAAGLIYKFAGGPWALANLAAIMVVVAGACPTRAGMRRWTLRHVAARVDTALPPDLME